MRLKFTILLLVISVFLAACNQEEQNESTNINSSEDIKQLVDDFSTGKISDVQSASITSGELIITEMNDKESVYTLPEDEFFVSIAPFISETHPCTNHSLTSCQGELVKKDFDIYIEDMEGHVILDETMSSGANGFIDLWLPRDRTFRVKITHDDKEVESEISTFENDGTCITTMQLL